MGVAAAGLRFACLLPPGHLLTKTAEQLQRQQEFETALQASKAAAAAAAAAARSQQHAPALPMLQLPGRHVPRYGEQAAACYLVVMLDLLLSCSCDAPGRIALVHSTCLLPNNFLHKRAHAHGR